jgi:uncharacterized membrane protein
MRFQVILVGSALVVAVVAFLSSRYVRAVFKESIVHPRDRCEIEVDRTKVSVTRTERSQNSEG